jgi:DNA polymerase-3 subunit chi
LNLTKAVPPHYDAFQRIIEIVCEEETQRESAREKYRYYRQQQCQLSSHSL